MNQENITEYDASTEDYIGFLPADEAPENQN